MQKASVAEINVIRERGEGRERERERRRQIQVQSVDTHGYRLVCVVHVGSVGVFAEARGWLTSIILHFGFGDWVFH